MVVETADEQLLFDCGPGTVRRLLEEGINPGAIDHLLFTHHHIDHNADFYNFVINNWTRGDGQLEIHGPNPWTERLLQSMYEVYEEDIQYRDHVGYAADPVLNLEVNPITDGSTVTTDDFRISTRSVDHSIETYGYRIENTETDTAVVLSGDTRKIDQLSEFASGADVLVQDCCIAPGNYTGPDDENEFVWEQYLHPLPAGMRDRLQAVHCNPTEAGEIAAAAGVDLLILTHLLPYRDEAAMLEMAEEVFEGEVLVAYDGLEFVP